MSQAKRNWNQSERKKSGSDIKIKATVKYKRTEIISRGGTIHDKISSETV